MLRFIRTTTVALLCSIFSIPAFSQSDAFACSGLTAIPVGTICTNTNGSLYNFTVGTPTATCGTAYDGWYTFTVPSNTNAVSFDLSAAGSSNLDNTNCYMQAFSATSCVPSPIGNCTALGTTLDLTGLTPSGIYYIRVFSTISPTSNPSSKWAFKICATYTPPPSNDDCSGATTLTSGVTNSSGTVWNATASSVSAGCATGDPDDDVWYKIVATGTSFTASISGTGLNSNSPKMQLFSSSGTCASISSMACGTNSISTTVTSGSTYYIRVYSNQTGALASSTASAFSITATTVVPPTPPGNDECSSAYLIPTATSCLDSRGTLTGASTSSGIPIGTCTGTADDDVWYKFVAQKSNPTISLSSIATSITGTGGGAVLQLLSGTDCSSLSSVACVTNTSTSLSYTASGLTVGATYYVRVFSKNAIALSSATFDICVTIPTPEVVVDSTSALFNIDIVGKNLGYPWEITYGPDDSLWITEARGYRVVRMSASRTATDVNTAAQQILKIPLGSSQVSFDRTVGTWPQGGMQGLAIHPEFATDPSKQWVYLSYVYSGTCPSNSSSPCTFRTKLVRCQFYYATDVGNPSSLPKKDTLIILDTIMSNLPGSNDHNSGRLKIGPTKEGTGTPTYKLYYTIGDMGAGQFNNTSRTNYALTMDTCEGKILRLNTEPDGDGVPGSPTHDFDKYRQWIPNDNPFSHSVLTTLKTPIYSYGHRNPQGLAWGNINGTWRLYSSEHGDRSDDEVNIIESGSNYGWPKVTGKADNNYTTADDAGDGFTMNNILANGTISDETSYANAHANYKDPLFDFLNWSPAQIETINTGNIFTWPTIAPSSIEFYNSAQIPGWKNSLLVTSLKYGMFRLKLNAAGDAIDSTSCTNLVDTFPLFHGWRVRDIAVSPNGAYIWAVIDSSGSTSGPTGGFGGTNSNTKDGGRLIKLSFKNMVTLPVHFLTFNGRLLTDKTIRLFWEATTDQSHSYFDVERSTDNANFISLGHVTSGPPYNFIDASPNIGNNYYRIRQVNSDGVSKYSRVINIPYEPFSFIVSAYPNPIQDVLTVRISAPGRDNVNVTVTDVQGRTVYSSQNIVDRNVTTITIDTRTWASQMYLLKCTSQDNKVLSSQKIMKAQ